MDSDSISVYPMAAWCIWHMRRCYKPIVRSCVHSQRHISSRGCDRTQDIVRVHGDYRYYMSSASQAIEPVAGSLVSVRCRHGSLTIIIII